MQAMSCHLHLQTVPCTCRFPMDDHQVAPLELMMRMLRDCSDWMDAHPENVVIIHCKAGGQACTRWP